MGHDDGAVPENGMIPHVFPLRPGLRAHLVLPVDLTREDAERIAGFVASLAFAESGVEEMNRTTSGSNDGA